MIILKSNRARKTWLIEGLWSTQELDNIIYKEHISGVYNIVEFLEKYFEVVEIETITVELDREKIESAYRRLTTNTNDMFKFNIGAM